MQLGTIYASFPNARWQWRFMRQLSPNCTNTVFIIIHQPTPSRQGEATTFNNTFNPIVRDAKPQNITSVFANSLYFYDEAQTL
jgi:hypothetical protein